MLYLGGPSTTFNGVTVLSDYSDPRQFYYLPPPPRLTRDPQSGQLVFKLVKFAGGLIDPSSQAAGGGVAFFDCDLALSKAELEELEAHVRQELRISSGPTRLSPIAYKEGSVSCYVLGEQTWSEDEEVPPERQNLFVERLVGFGVPSLYGDNRAAFSARLSPAGSTVLDASLQEGGPIGISIVYNLKFDALQPAFKFSVKANWEQVYHYIEEKVGVDLFICRVENTNLVEELEQRQLLKFEEVAFDPAASGDLSQLRKQVQELILEKFFTPILSVGEPKTGRIPGMVSDIVRATVLTPSFGYQRRELTQTERRSFSFDCTRINAVERTIHPQANLFALLPPAELERYVQEVITDADLFYRQLDVQCVIGGIDFAKSKVAWVHPRIRYGAPPEEGTDRTLTSERDVMPFRTWLQQAHGFRYRRSYEVAFAPPDSADPETIYGKDAKLSSAEVTSTDRVLAITPTELFDVQGVEFAVQPGFPWDRYPGVLVEVLHRGADDHEVRHSYTLSVAQAAARFRVRYAKGKSGLTHYRVSYLPGGVSSLVTTDWQVATEPHVGIPDPFPRVFSVRVHIAEPASALGWVDVSLRYQESPGRYQEQLLSFDPAQLAAQTWTARTLDLHQRSYEYRFSLFADGDLLESSDWVESDAPTLTIGRGVPTQRSVAVSVTGSSFAAENLRDVTVTAWPETAAEGAPGTELMFDAADQTRELTYRALDPTRVGSRYEAFYRWNDGRTKSVRSTLPVNTLTLRIPTRV